MIELFSLSSYRHRSSRDALGAEPKWNSGFGQSVIEHHGNMLEASMPVILVPILWVAGGVAVLGGGYYVITHLVH
jgi:hypothetical protein